MPRGGGRGGRDGRGGRGGLGGLGGRGRGGGPPTNPGDPANGGRPTATASASNMPNKPLTGTPTNTPPKHGFLKTLFRPVLVPSTLCAVEERHAWVDDCMDGAVGKAMNFVPLYVMTLVACPDLTLGLWLSFGFAALRLVVDAYRSTFRADVPPVNPFAAFNAVVNAVFLVLAYEASGFDYTYVTPLLFSALTALVTVGLATGRPFTEYGLSNNFPPHVRESKRFHEMNLRLTAFAVLVLLAATACAWIGFAVFPDDRQTCTSSTGGFLLSTIMPAVIPLLGFLFVKAFLLKRLEQAYLGDEALELEGDLEKAKAVDVDVDVDGGGAAWKDAEGKVGEV